MSVGKLLIRKYAAGPARPPGEVNLGGGFATGCYACSRLSGGGFYPSTGLHGWLRMIIWFVLIGVWALASIRVLRPSSGAGRSPEPESRSDG